MFARFCFFLYKGYLSICYSCNFLNKFLWKCKYKNKFESLIVETTVARIDFRPRNRHIFRRREKRKGFILFGYKWSRLAIFIVFPHLIKITWQPEEHHVLKTIIFKCMSTRKSICD